MVHDLMSIAMRFIHIAAAVVAVGGACFVAVCLSPAMRLVDDAFRKTILGLVDRRFGYALWTSIGLLVVSGVYNWVNLAADYRDMGPIGNALIGAKVLVALILFVLLWAQRSGLMALTTPRSVAIGRAVNLLLAAVIILMAVILRHLRLQLLGG